MVDGTVLAAILAAFFIGAAVSFGAVVLGAWIASRFIKTDAPLFAQEEMGSVIQTDIEDEPVPGRNKGNFTADVPDYPQPTALLQRQNARFLQQMQESAAIGQGDSHAA